MQDPKKICDKKVFQVRIEVLLFIHVNIAIHKRFDSGINVMSRHTFERILVKFH